MAQQSTARQLMMGLIVAICALLAIEGLSRVGHKWAPQLFELPPLDPGPGSLSMGTDPDLLWRLNTGKLTLDGIDVEIGSMGLRGGDPSLVSGQPRVLFLGDSSVFGWGVSRADAFPWQLQTLLAKEGVRVEIVNGGTPGYSSAQSRFQLEALAPAVSPHVVVVANLWSDMMRTGWRDAELFEQFGSETHSQILATQDGLQGSFLYKLMRTQLIQKRSMPADRRLLWDTVLQGDSSAYLPRSSPSEHLRNLKAIAQTAVEHGATPIALILPTNWTSEHPPAFVLKSYQTNLKTMSRTWGTPAVDMPARWEGLDEDQISERFIDRVHPSALGHKEIAEALLSPILGAISTSP